MCAVQGVVDGHGDGGGRHRRGVCVSWGGMRGGGDEGRTLRGR
jgi:hypothetical protein